MDTSKTSSVLRAPSDDEIPGLLAELAKSDESLAPFARRRGLSTWKLYKARRKSTAKRPAAPAFEKVRIVHPTVVSSCIEVEHSSGHRLRVPAGFDEVTLRRVLAVLGSC